MSFLRGAGGWHVFLASAALGATACLLVTPPKDNNDKAAPVGASGGSAGSGSQEDASPAGSSAGDAPTGECQVNADCIETSKHEMDAPYRCRSDHRCVKLRTDECSVLIGDTNWTDKNAIFFGGFAGRDPGDPGKTATQWNYELAINELSGDNIGGLKGLNGEPHPLVMVLCNNDPQVLAADPDFLARSMTHLVDTLEVPAIVAYLLPGDLRRAFEKGKEKDVFFISPIGLSRELALTSDKGLLWHMLGRPGDFAPAYVDLVKRIEAYQKKTLTGTTIKVAAVIGSDAFSQELSDALSTTLEFNGKKIADNADNYMAWTVPPTGAHPDQIGMQIRDFRPNIVVSIAAEEFVQADTGVLDTLENKWVTAGPMFPRPFYVLSPLEAGSLNVVTKRISSLGAAIPSTHQRFLGVSAAGGKDLDLYYRWRTILRNVHPSANDQSENFYDAMYYLAYAMVGAGIDDRPLTGLRIAGGMRRLLGGGTSYKVGSDDVSNVFADLNAMGKPNIELIGVLGPPNFDLVSGARIDKGSVFCFDMNGTPKPQALRYDDTAQKLVGTFSCYAGFDEP